MQKQCKSNEIIKGKMTIINAVVITSGESKSLINGSAVMQMIKCKITPSNLLRISLLYGFTVKCIKAIISQTTMNT